MAQFLGWKQGGKNWGKSTQSNLKFFDGHFINLEKGLASSGFELDMSVNGWACSYESSAGLVWVLQHLKKFDSPYWIYSESENKKEQAESGIFEVV